jgi:hypothetical protein
LITGRKWGHIDKRGGWVVQPEFERTEPFRDSRGLVKLDGKFGFVDSKGALVVPAQYDQALSFSEGLAAVRQGAKWGYIDGEQPRIGRHRDDALGKGLGRVETMRDRRVP